MLQQAPAREGLSKGTIFGANFNGAFFLNFAQTASPSALGATLPFNRFI
jgi:hypothetical protein